MSDLISSEIPEEEEVLETEEAPWGYKKDGTPRKRPGRQPGSGGGGGHSRGGRSSKLEALQEPLAERLVEYFGPPVAMISPLAVAVLDERAEKTAAGLIRLAAGRPRIRKAIERLIEGSASADVSLTVVGMGVAVLVDTERMDITSKPSRYFHIDSLAEETYSDTTAFYNRNGNNGVAARGLMGEVIPQ